MVYTKKLEGQHDMNKQFKISICIPTYNRAKYLKDAIESILTQENTNVEIVVSDNASTDNTEELIEYFQKENPNITYFRWDENMGPDKNFLKAVEIASGEYCWYLGSDDTLKAGSIAKVYEAINYAHDIVLCNRTICNLKMEPITNCFWLESEIGDTTFNLVNNQEIKRYFDTARSIGALFSYLSSLIFRRDRWNNIHFDKKFGNTGYSHVYMLLSILNTKRCSLRYIEQPLVNTRFGNDSFLQAGQDSVVNRVLIDFNGYVLFAEHFFSNDLILKKAFCRVLIYEYPWYRILRIRLVASSHDKWNLIKRKLLYLGFNTTLLNIYDYVILPKQIINTVVKIKIFLKGY